QSLLKDYRSQQAAAERDLAGGSDLSALWAENADRESAFLLKIKGVAITSDGLAGSLNDASQSTVAIAAKKHADDKAKAKDKTDKGHTGIPVGNCVSSAILSISSSSSSRSMWRIRFRRAYRNSRSACHRSRCAEIWTEVCSIMRPLPRVVRAMLPEGLLYFQIPTWSRTQALA